MTPRELLNIMETAQLLKDATRHCYTQSGKKETVAEHSWLMSFMAMCLKDQFPDVDMNKVMKMCIVHDLGECFTGDIPVHLKTSADNAKEEELLYAWVDTLPKPFGDELKALYDEMAALETPEARIYKSLDKLEAIAQHNLSDLSTWEPHEYQLQKTYAIDFVAFSDYLSQLRGEILNDTLKKIGEA